MWHIFYIVNGQVGGTRKRLVGWVKADDGEAAVRVARTNFGLPSSVVLEAKEAAGEWGQLPSIAL